jgi:hypothetical protein
MLVIIALCEVIPLVFTPVPRLVYVGAKPHKNTSITVESLSSLIKSGDCNVYHAAGTETMHNGNADELRDRM